MKKVPSTPSLIASILVICACFSAIASINFSEDYTMHRAAMTTLDVVDDDVDTHASIKLALLLDTSNSMDGLINQAKSQLWEIVNNLAKANYQGDPVKLQIALYEYGNDNLQAKEGYIRQVSALSSDLDVISEKLFSLSTLGGNEFCGQVIQSSLNQLDWGDEDADLKLIYIAGNEEFTQGTVTFQSACELANEKDVFVNTIFCGPHEEGIDTQWKDGALLGNGEYLSIQQDLVTAYVQTPYDEDITRLNQALNDTYIAYGKKGHLAKSNQVAQDDNAGSIAYENAVGRTISKSSSLYKNESWDIVDACESADFELDDLSEEELPEEMKEMDSEEKEKFVSEKKEERESIQSEIAELADQRALFIQENADNGDENLQNAMLTALRKQAESKGFSFE